MTVGDTTAPARSPRGTIEEVWREYQKWSAISRSMKTKENRFRDWAAYLGLGGAALGAAAGVAPETSLAGIPVASALGSASAGAVGFATYLSQKILKPEGQRPWTRARSLAEALKRAVWLSLFSVPPYDGSNADLVLEKRAEAFRENTVKDLPIEAQPAVENKPPPSPAGVEDYVRSRMQEQIDWYARRVAEFTAKVTKWKRVSGVLGLLASASGLSMLTRFGLSSWVPVLTTATAAVAAHLASQRYQTLIPLYQDTERALRFRLARWRNLSDDQRTDEEARSLIQDSEEIMARENESWRAEWKSDEGK